MKAPEGFESRWYETEKNTVDLIKAVTADRGVDDLSGKDIRALLQLTWITKSGDHWRNLKIPALVVLFNTDEIVADDLIQSVQRMKLPRLVKVAAKKRTGFVNAYTAYRNSLKNWCSRNVRSLRSILKSAESLGSDDQARIDLTARITEMPRVPTPNNKRTKAASDFITPLLACLDPKSRFPMINGNDRVRQRLARLGLTGRSLPQQAKGLIGLIDKFGLRDAFAVDTMTDDQIKDVTRQRNLPKPSTAADHNRGNGTPLHVFDEAERAAAQKSATIAYRNRHNRMTNRLQKLLPNLAIGQGVGRDCRYDALVTDYDENGRDLLIEAKPDPDKGSIRIAIGQLLDYRRFLPHQAGTDLAILTISHPTQSHVDLLLDLQMTALWFDSGECTSMSGRGMAWKAIDAQLKGKAKDSRS